MKIWKRFKQWIFISRSEVPSKAERVGSSTSGSQQQSAVKMLEMLITPKSLPLFLSRECVNTKLISRTSLDSRNCSTLLDKIREPTKKSPLAKQAYPQHSTVRMKVLIVPPCSLSHTIYSRTRTFSEGSPSTRCLKRRRDENEDIAVEEMSQTQEDSQGSFILTRHPRHP